MTVATASSTEQRAGYVPAGTGDDLLTWEALTALVRRFRVLLIVSVLVGATLPVVLTLTRPRTYTATARFVLNRSSASAGIGGIASQLGLTGGDAGTWDSPGFYAELVSSRELLWRVAQSPIGSDSAAGGQPRTVLDVLGARADSPPVTKDRAVMALRSSLDARVVSNGIVEVKARTTDPVVSRDVAANLLDELNRFILGARQGRSTAERQFSERRLRETQQELRAAQDAVAAFMERNRSYQNAPDLRVRYERLLGDVAMRQQLFSAAVLAYEQAKVEEIRDTPLLSVIEAPDAPVRPDPRGLVRKAGIGGFVGGALAAFLVLVIDFRARMRRRPMLPGTRVA